MRSLRYQIIKPDIGVYYLLTNNVCC